jgi:hypothetical protein
VEIVKLVRGKVYCDVCEGLFGDGRDEQRGAIKILEVYREGFWVTRIEEPVVLLDKKSEGTERWKWRDAPHW